MLLDINEILEQLITEREFALNRVKLLNETIEVIQREGSSAENLDFLKSFLEASNKGGTRRIIIQSSKLNAHTDLVEKYAGYSETKNVKDKIVLILQVEGHFLHVKEIANILLELDFEKSKKLEDYLRNISPVLSTMAKNNDRICKFSDGNKKSTIWGLKIWLENGQPLNDFLI